MKIAFISNHPAPYRDPFLNRLVKTERFSVDVFTQFPKDRGHDYWNLVKPEYSSTLIVPTPRSTIRVFLYMLRTFVFGSYDLVVYPGFLLWYLTACMLISAIIGKKYGFFADTVVHDECQGLRQRIKKYIVRHASLIGCPGKAGTSYWGTTYGVPSTRICTGAYALDNEAIAARIAAERKHRDILRKSIGLTATNKVFLMVANMIPSRHYPITTAAFLRMSTKHPDAKYIIVGRGPVLDTMMKLSKEHPQIIVFPGVEFDKMLKLYALADVYVHGGTEPASTALVIGAIAGLPLVSSMAVGCAWDCLEHETSGFCVRDYLSVDDWQNGFEWMMQHEDRWAEMGVAANTLSEALSVPRTLEAFETLVMNIGGRKTKEA